MGPLPSTYRRVPLDIEIQSREETSDYTRLKLTYAPEPGDRVPALLLVPKNVTISADGFTGAVANRRPSENSRGFGGKLPAMLCLHPTNPDVVFAPQVDLFKSIDGGRTFTDARGGCGDCHDVWIDPLNADHYVVTGDGGMGITTTHGRSYTSVVLPIGQMYHVAVDNRIPYWIYSNRQDDGTMRSPHVAWPS